MATHEDQSIYQQKLGEKFNALPNQLRSFHQLNGPKTWSGKASITGGSNLPARGIRALFGFPPPTDEIAVHVQVERGSKDGLRFEQWTRTFGKHIFQSRLYLASDWSFTEKFGVLKFQIGLDVKDRTIVMPVISWKIGPLVLPLILAPRSETVEYEDSQGRFCFDVRVSLPIVGLLMHYRGYLEPADG